MTEQEWIESLYKALEEWKQLPSHEKKRRLLARGRINERGEVIMHPDADGAPERVEEDGRNGAPRCPSETRTETPS